MVIPPTAVLKVQDEILLARMQGLLGKLSRMARK